MPKSKRVHVIDLGIVGPDGLRVCWDSVYEGLRNSQPTVYHVKSTGKYSHDLYSNPLDLVLAKGLVTKVYGVKKVKLSAQQLSWLKLVAVPVFASLLKGGTNADIEIRKP